MFHLSSMKTLLFVFIILSSCFSFAQTRNTRNTYIMTPRGPVRVLTPADLKKHEAQKEQNLKGVGMEFPTKASVEKEEVKVFVRGCSWVSLGSTQITEDSSEEEKKQAQKLKSIKNGDLLSVKMDSYGSCSVKDWRKR